MLSKRSLISKLYDLHAEKVVIAGFVEKIKKFKNLTVLVIRDCSGTISANFSLDKLDPSSITRESVVLVSGTIKKLERMKQLEIEGEDIELLSKAKSIPIDLNEDRISEEKYRMRYRYLDLRRKALQQNINFSSKAKLISSEYLNNLGFSEVDTPILSFTTKEGANTFSTLANEQVKESFTLAQSPQLYKQLLMISGFESYFQFSKSFRAEKLREDRQYEFTQLDIELAFSTTTKLFEIIENLLIKIIYQLLRIKLEKKDFPIITYEEAILKFGTDKPDLRNSLIIRNWSSPNSLLEIYYYILLPDVEIEESQLNSLLKNKFKCIYKDSGGKLIGDLNEISSEFINSLNLKSNDYVFYLRSNKKLDKKCLYSFGNLRNEIFKLGLINSEKNNPFKFAWIVDWHYFEKNKNGELVTSHHPFTLPIQNSNNIMNWKSTGYDLVLNGSEIASGSVRITDSTLQRKIFKLLGYSEELIDKEFGWFLNALEYGTPPHQGIAIGWERLIQKLLGLQSIREVIAFPKNSHGSCSMSSHKLFD